MYAIVETGGKQYPVEEGRYVDVELLDVEKDSKVVFDKIIMIVNGKKSKVGQPYVSGASAEGTVLAHDKAKKVIVFKQRPKKVLRNALNILAVNAPVAFKISSNLNIIIT